MSEQREWTEEMGEISGFGGSYEAGCRAMVLAGLAWWDEHPDADPHFHGYEGIAGMIVEDDEDAKALTRAMLDAEVTIGDEVDADGIDVDPHTTTVGEYGATGAMVQWSVNHVLAARRLGWEEYARQLAAREEEEAS